MLHPLPDVGLDDGGGLLGEDPRQPQPTARRHGPDHLLTELNQGTGEDVGDDAVVDGAVLVG